jgi:hypothetical protein
MSLGLRSHNTLDHIEWIDFHCQVLVREDFQFGNAGHFDFTTGTQILILEVFR